MMATLTRSRLRRNIPVGWNSCERLSTLQPIVCTRSLGSFWVHFSLLTGLLKYTSYTAKVTKLQLFKIYGKSKEAKEFVKELTKGH